MESVIRVEIDVPQAKLAGLFADPRNSTKWMVDLERYEPISGEPGQPASTYRLVQKKGAMEFVATVISRNLPHEVRIALDESTVSVSVTASFVALSPGRTLLTSREIFRFKGLRNRLFGFFARPAIDKAHRDQMEAFKRFAEEQ